MKIKKISEAVIGLLEREDVIKQEEVEIYRYGLNVILYNLFIMISILSIGILINRLRYTIIFLIVFSITRSFSGGYHAKTKLKCFVLTNLIHLITISFSFIQINVEGIILICNLFSILGIFWFVPLQDEVEQKEEHVIKLNTNISRCIVFTSSIMSLMGYYLFSNLKQECLIMSISMSAVILLIITKKLEEKINE